MGREKDAKCTSSASNILKKKTLIDENNMSDFKNDLFSPMNFIDDDFNVFTSPAVVIETDQESYKNKSTFERQKSEEYYDIDNIKNYSINNENDNPDLELLFSIVGHSHGDMAMGRIFNIKKDNGENYFVYEVVGAFIRYKLDPELQRKMPGLEFGLASESSTTCYRIYSQYDRTEKW